MTVFMRLLHVPADNKALVLQKLTQQGGVGVYIVDPEEFRVLPTRALSYWLPETVRKVFAEAPALSENYTAASTNPLNDDFRYVRVWWETSRSDQCEWRLWAKGGRFSKFYYDIDTVIAWSLSRNTYHGYLGTANRPLERPASLQHFLRPGLTWPRRTQGGLGFRVLPTNCLFSDKGPALFVEGDDGEGILSLLAIVSSAPFEALIGAQMAFGSYEVGVVQRTPVPIPEDGVRATLASLARLAWHHERSHDLGLETSHAFELPERLGRRAVSEKTTAQTQGEIDAICFELYGFSESDLREAELETASNSSLEAVDISEVDPIEREGLEFDLLSWSVGVAFARFDIRLATGERAVPPEPDPLDPLPAKSPGMLPDGDAPFMPTSGVLVDDPGHAEDLAARMMAVYERVSGTPPTPEELRRTLAKDFFPAHIRMYSKSRRKAPIYWQLATPSSSYSVWLYIHDFGKDTLFRVQNDYVVPKLAHERRELEALQAEAGPSPPTIQSRAIEAQTAFVEELSALLDEVKRVAPLWNPDLDDGVILNFAPLWRLVPQNRAWQKELRAAWASLVAGDYDWAHLSMRLWPDRVVPKCAKDRSLAIAHDLENVFWFEDAAGKWQARPTPTRPLDDLIAERTSVAVKSALQGLLEAPDPVAGSGRGRGRRKKN